MSLALYLVRHAQSADKQSGQSDHERELTATGRRDATALGLFFHHQKYFFDLVVCSTATRTKQTAELILAEIKNSSNHQTIFEEYLYQGTGKDYYNRLTNLHPSVRSVLLVAHNPSISDLLSILVQGPTENFSPGGFAELYFELEDWSDLLERSGKLVTYRNPIN